MKTRFFITLGIFFFLISIQLPVFSAPLEHAQNLAVIPVNTVFRENPPKHDLLLAPASASAQLSAVGDEYRLRISYVSPSNKHTS